MGKPSDDITRYHNNEMSARERHDFEKRALSDPFLADAIEGAEKVDPKQFSEDVNSLNQKLLSRRDHAWGITVRIAAGVIMVFVVGWLVYRENGPVPEPLASQANDSIVSPAKDSTDQLLTLAQPKSSEPSAATPSTSGAKPQQSPAGSSKAIAKAPDQEADSKSTSGSARAEEQLSSEKVTPATAAESADRSAAAPQSIALGASEKKALSESAKKDDKENEVTSAARANTRLADSPPTPVGGFDAYQKYLDKNKQTPEAAQRANLRGIVQIDFTINVDGSLTGFTVVKALGLGCEEEVLRLIQKGPKWSPAIQNGEPKAATTRVSVTF